MDTVPFEGPRAKLRRARKHIAELELAMAAYGERVEQGFVEDPAGADAAPQPGMICWRFALSEPLPTELPFIVGDAIHNGRAALDVMMCDIARVRGVDAKRVNFPFGSDAVLLDAALKREVRRLGQDVVASVRSLKPYKGGSAELNGLHELDIKDKHQLVLPAVAVQSAALPMMFSPELMEDAFPGSPWNSFYEAVQRDARGWIREGDVSFSAPGRNPGAGIRLVGPPMIFFPSGMPFAGHPLVPVLKHLIHTVESVVEDFANQFGPNARDANGS